MINIYKEPNFMVHHMGDIVRYSHATYTQNDVLRGYSKMKDRIERYLNNDIEKDIPKIYKVAKDGKRFEQGFYSENDKDILNFYRFKSSVYERCKESLQFLGSNYTHRCYVDYDLDSEFIMTFREFTIDCRTDTLYNILIGEEIEGMCFFYVELPYMKKKIY